MTRPGARAPASEVVVIGGGIAGCTVAYELARRGFGVTLLE
jgi:glycine/D-amino acid oxidase-like deaminating enzyme